MEHHGRRALSLSVDLGQQQLTSGALGEMQTHGRSPGPRSQSLHCTRLQAIRSHTSAWESLVLKSSPSFIVPDSTINSPAPCTSIDHPFGEALQGLLLTAEEAWRYFVVHQKPSAETNGSRQLCSSSFLLSDHKARHRRFPDV